MPEVNYKKKYFNLVLDLINSYIDQNNKITAKSKLQSLKYTFKKQEQLGNMKNRYCLIESIKIIKQNKLEIRLKKDDNKLFQNLIESQYI
ncbi:unnamed protein product [Paramecium sonneborni]|uniref:Uncharacterized protein n=1 Tax=Paramecium sonneborni TaxID=65129 RepID=A0A8S1KMN2_9CILI|nr:unnamed protein product [Paramecium sonneborni]